MTSLVGYLAGVLTTAAPLSQAIKTVRSGKTDDLSFGMWGMQTAGVALWVLFGILMESLPLIIMNSLTLAFVGIILGVMVRNRLRRNRTS